MSDRRTRRTSGRTAAVLALALGALAPIACRRSAPPPAAPSPVVGVKIYEAAPPFDGLFRAWRDLGVNTAFVSEGLLGNAEFRAAAKSGDVKLFLIFPVFQDPEAIKADPGLAAIDAAGRPAKDEWVEFVCPAREEFLRRKIDRLKALVAAGDPFAVSLDFIRYFVFWEKVAPDRDPASLPQTCFCPVCLEGFRKEMGLAIPADLTDTAGRAAWILSAHAAEWAEWKCRTIARAVARLADAAREVKPAVKVNLHAVPWRSDDFGGAVRAVAGQDLARLAPLVDLISPMCYHHMVRRTPAWVHDVVAEIAARTGAPVLASTQVGAAYVEEPLGPDEFRAAAVEALKPPSTGVVFWSWDALSKSPEKQALLRRLVH
jgi:hypothetical protein